MASDAALHKYMLGMLLQVASLVALGVAFGHVVSAQDNNAEVSITFLPWSILVVPKAPSSVQHLGLELLLLLRCCY
jgi:hypothetical protein